MSDSRKPTIADLQRITAEKGPYAVAIMPDGKLRERSAEEIEQLVRQEAEVGKPPTSGYYWSTDNVTFTRSEKHATRWSAGAEAIRDQGLEPGDELWTAEMASPATARQFAPTDVVGLMADNARDNLGECAEGWPDSTKEQAEELDRLVAGVVALWAKEHGLEPTFGPMVNVEEHVTAGSDEPEDCLAPVSGNWEGPVQP